MGDKPTILAKFQQRFDRLLGRIEAGRIGCVLRGLIGISLFFRIGCHLFDSTPVHLHLMASHHHLWWHQPPRR